MSLAAIAALAGRCPILGVCLGHQCIGQAFGGRIVRAPEVRHGKTSPIYHADTGVFAGLPNPFDGHALPFAGDWPRHLPTRPGDHRLDRRWADYGRPPPAYPIEGVQFHPESILTEGGHALLRNFLAQVGSFQPSVVGEHLTQPLLST